MPTKHEVEQADSYGINSPYPIKNWAMALNQFAILCDTNLQNWANGEIVLTQKI